jgi:hypothetical protein
MHLGEFTCESGDVDEMMRLKFKNVTLLKKIPYTFGVGVYNPGGKPDRDLNYWGCLLRDNLKETFDGNLRIKGLELKSLPVRVGVMGWSTPEPRVLSMVLIQVRVFYEIPAGTVTAIVIRAPLGIMFKQDSNSVSVRPLELPLREASSTTVAGETIHLNLDAAQPVAQGTYNIRFEVSNPGTVALDNTWAVFVKKNLDMEFSHILPGYEPGQVTPVDVAGSGGAIATTNSAVRRAGGVGACGAGAFAVAISLGSAGSWSAIER